MDIRCRKCAEPIDMDELHDIAADMGTTYHHVRDTFAQYGCRALGMRCNENADSELATISGALFDMLGDDIDGVASTLEEWEYLNR